MKLLYFPVVTALGAITLAAPRDDAAPSEISSDGAKIPSFSDTHLAAPLSFNQPTNPQTADLIEGAGAIRVFLTGHKQHVGSHFGQSLYDPIRECLEELCPSWDNHPYCHKHACKIEQVEYDDNGVFAADGILELRILNTTIPRGNAAIPGIKAIIDMIAFSYKAMSDAYFYNCYWQQLGNTRFFCNVGEFVEVDVWNGTEVMGMRTGLVFRGKTERGGFSCKAALRGADKYLRGTVEPKLMRVLGLEVFERFVGCG